MGLARFYGSAFAAGFGAFLAILAIVFLTGSTFGQRCDRAFPHDTARSELCVYHLSKGEAP